MPRVIGLTNEQKVEHQKQNVIDQCQLLMKHSKVTQKDVASFLGLTPPAISYQFRSGNITLGTLIAVLTLTDAEQGKINLKIG